MQTNFSIHQLKRPDIQEIESILRKCVHCGFCLPSCPTYSILGDERDSPRGRIYLIKELIESNGDSAASVAPHVDRCLSCLACTTACPSGVDYQHYIDFAQTYLENHLTRSRFDRILRAFLAKIIPNPLWFRFSLLGARLVRPVAGLFGKNLKSIIDNSPKRLVPNGILKTPKVFSVSGEYRMRVGLLTGCVQQVLRPSINEATIRLLNRLGCEVVLAKGSGCCGAINLHLGRRAEAQEFARINIKSWIDEFEGEGLDAVVINASGCGTVVKDYHNLFKYDPVWRRKAEKISSMSVDITELIDEPNLPPVKFAQQFTVLYHDACSLLHGQRIVEKPRSLLRQAGFKVKEIPGKHYCCGSAGIYNLMQNDIASLLRERRLEAIKNVDSDFICTGNIGCLMQLQGGLNGSVVHTVELLDWATGGPPPSGI